MYFNLHSAVPEGWSLITVAVTRDPYGTPASEMSVDEVDVLLPTRGNINDIYGAEELRDYAGCRVVGIANQSAGVIFMQDPNSTETVPE